jgi:hypothetical protein
VSRSQSRPESSAISLYTRLLESRLQRAKVVQSQSFSSRLNHAGKSSLLPLVRPPSRRSPASNRVAAVIASNLFVERQSSINVAPKNTQDEILVEKSVSIRMLLGNGEVVAPPHFGNRKCENSCGVRKGPRNSESHSIDEVEDYL